MAENETALVDASKGWGLEDFTLKHPFSFAGQEFRKFDVRVPTGADIEAFIRGKESSVRSLVDLLVDADAKVLNAMHGADYSRLLKFVGKFLADSR